MPTFKLTKKTLSHIFLHAFCLHFLRILTTNFSEEAWKWASTISFRKYKWKVVLLVIYLFNYDSSKSTFFMLNMVFDVLFLAFWVQFLLHKLEFFVSCNNTITRTSSFCSVFWSNFFKKVIVLHHGDNNFLFYFDICNQIRTFNNHLKDEEMITSHLICVINSLWWKCCNLCYNFFMIKIADKPWQIMLHAKPFHHSKI